MSTSPDTLHIVLLGKTGSGKSSTSNSLIYPRIAFRAMQSAQSITSNCQEESTQWTDQNGQIKQILVVDTPGFFDSDENLTNEMVEKKITQQIFEMTSPGVHAFLIVIRIGRFSPEEKRTVDFIKTIFGTDAAKYCIVVFTHGDQLEDQTISDFIASSPHLQELMTICNNRKLVINNKSNGQVLQTKIQQLLQIIQDMVRQNDGSYYTNEIYKQIQQKREQERIEKEKEEEARQQQIIQIEIEKSNEVVDVRIEKRKVKAYEYATPIFSTERKRRSDIFSQLISINGSGYKYYQQEVGKTITTYWHEEQREIKILRNGLELSGDWKIIRKWSTKS